ncbi:Phthiocerol synthesis polyketide synthase type I PpsA [Durusdinium trenchii]
MFRACRGAVGRAFASERFTQRLGQLLGPESNRWWRRLEGKKTLPGLSATAKAKDLELRFERLGNVNAGCVPEVVITPRGQLDLSAARALAFALAKEHISVLIWDRRGSGASSVWAPLTEASLPEQEVEDLKVLLDFVQTDRVVLVGLSSGARLSALFAAKYPSRVAGLAVLPTGDAAGAASVLAQAYYGDCREVAEQGGMEAIVATPGSQFHALAQREMQRRALLSVDVKEFVDVMLNSQVFIEGFIGEAFLGLYPEDLRQLQIPALVFHHGFKDDRLHVLEDAEEVARHLKTSLEDAADVEALQMALIAFVKSVAPAGGSGRPA